MVYDAFVIKRKPFEHERELRAVTSLPWEGEDFGEPVLTKADRLREQTNPTVKRKIDSDQMTGSGKYVPVNVDILIEKIYISPLAESWFSELVKSLLEKFSIDTNRIIISDLYDLPYA